MLCAIYEYQSHLAGVKTEDKTVKYLHRVTIRELGMLRGEQSASCVAEFSKNIRWIQGLPNRKSLLPLGLKGQEERLM